MTTSLNIPQEQELHRLLEYERHACGDEGGIGRVAFPYRPNDMLQSELVQKGMLTVRDSTSHGAVVLISSDGYSYFAELQRMEVERRRASQRDLRIETFAVMLGAICVIVGFLLGRFLA